MKIFGSWTELQSLVLRIATRAITLKPNQTVTYTADRDVELPPQNANAVLVSESASQSLTNKTIDADQNTITNIENADIKAAAAIDATKIADGSVTNTEFQTLSDISTGSTIQSQLNGKQATITGAASTIASSNLTASKALQSDASGKVEVSTVTSTELGYVSGVSSAIQTQLNGKEPTISILTTAKGGTGVNSTATFPSSGTVVTQDSTDTLLNKTTVSSTAASTGALKLPTGNSTTERPTGTATQLKGMVRYNDTDDVFEGYNELSGWSSIGGGGTTDRVTQASHAFVVGDVLYLNGSTYAKARADAANIAEVVGMVSRVIDANTFELTLSGEVTGLSGLTTGSVYFLSATSAGAITTTEPSVVGQVSLPVGVASSNTTMYVQPKRGIVIGATNVRTQIALANNATTTVQDVSAYEAGRLSGYVTIAATTSLKFYLEAKFNKNGAGTDYHVSYNTSGDTPPVGFLVSITAAGLLQVVMPSVTGFTSASINYGLDVAAVGATLPLSINPSIITVVDTSTEYSANTKLGLMQYVGGTNYNGGVSPTVSGTNFTTVRAVYVPYQVSDGTWRMKFNIQGNLSVASATLSLTVNGTTFKSGTNQACSGFHSDGVDTWVKSAINGSANTVSWVAGAARTGVTVSGDVELNSKPTWAY